MKRTTKHRIDIARGAGAAVSRRTFLRATAGAAGVLAAEAAGARLRRVWGAATRLEREDLKLGFIKLTDCAPLVIAKERGYFEDEGLYVTLEAQANWKILLDRVLSSELDGAHMLAGQPLGATIGIGTRGAVVTAFSMDLNGNAITVSNEVWKAMQAADPTLRGPKPVRPVKASALAPLVQERRDRGEPLRFGMVFPLSTHNYELRYWLAAGGIAPGFYTGGDTTGTTDAEVLLSVTPPPQMPPTLAQGTIQGYCVGEPWNQQAVFKGIGVPVITDYEIWKNNPEKVLGVTEAWSDAHPNTHVAMVKALIRAGQWLDESLENRREACRILARPEYVGADYEVIANSMTGTFEYEKGDTRELPDFNVFFRYHATYPFYSDAVWYLTQMRRWGQIAETRGDEWYDATARAVYRPDIHRTAAAALVERGVLVSADVPETDGYKPADAGFIDGVEYDGRKPNAYLEKLAIGLRG
jgi:nitrate/nitrite transport system substrate-binding protein